MKIPTHNHTLTSLSKLMESNNEDCSAWLEDILEDLRGETEEEDLFDKLGDNLYPEQVALISQQLIEHYNKEKTVSRGVVTSLIYNLRVN